MRKSSLRFKKGDIVAVELPFSDFSGSKLRPVLIVSGNTFNKNSNDVVVAKITSSSFDPTWEIKIDQEDLEEGVLKKPSVIDLSFLITIEKPLIKKKIGSVKKHIVNKVNAKLATLFEISF